MALAQDEELVVPGSGQVSCFGLLTCSAPSRWFWASWRAVTGRED